MTTGLIAGAASMNASAAAGAAPSAVSRPAMGTEPHSHPGKTAPARLADGTATAGRSGSSRAMSEDGTNAVTAPLTTTPRTRKGSACSVIDTNTVDHVCSVALSNQPATWGRSTTARTSTSTSSSGTNRPRRRRSSVTCSCVTGRIP
nr:hypothetical protein [Jiangella rhizosphaerae]